MDRPSDKNARIASILRQGNRFLAPLAGVGDPAFRALCKAQGAVLTYTEMVSAKGLQYGNANTENLLSLAHNEDHAGVQLFGTDPDIMAVQAQRIEEKWGDRLALIDINMGCPVAKVVKKGEGSALMRNPRLASKIISAINEAVEVPVTCKFRRGWEADSLAAIDFARMAEDSGASLVCVHGRSATQMYHGQSDWEIIRAVKEAVSIPVLGNGDLFSQDDIVRMLAETNVDGVMVARGARGNPWIFSGYQPTYIDRLNCALEHGRALWKMDPAHGIARMRKHITWYVAGMPHSASLRAAVMSSTTLDEFEELLLAALYELREKRHIDGQE